MFARAADSTVIERPDADDHRSFVAKGGGFCCKSWHVHFVHRRFISGSSNSIALDYQHCSPWRAISAATHVDPRFISPFVMEVEDLAHHRTTAPASSAVRCARRGLDHNGKTGAAASTTAAAPRDVTTLQLYASRPPRGRPCGCGELLATPTQSCVTTRVPKPTVPPEL
jgi:hypothetical protein